MARYIEIVLRYRFRFVALFLFLPLATAAVDIALTRTYTASAAIWVDDGTYLGAAGSISPSGWNQWLTPAQNETDIVTQLIRTEAFMTPLGDRLQKSGLSDKERSTAVGTLGTRLVILPTGSHLVSFTYTCDRAPVCLTVLEQVITVLREQESQLQKEHSKLGVDILKKQLGPAQDKLRKDQDDLQKYLADHPSLRIDTTRTDSALGIPDLDRLMRAADQDRQQVNALQSSLGTLTSMSDASSQVVQAIARTVDRPHLSATSRFGISGLNTKNLMLPLAGSLAIGIIYLLVLSWLDKTARDEKELERRLQVPVLVTIERLTGVREH